MRAAGRGGAAARARAGTSGGGCVQPPRRRVLPRASLCPRPNKQPPRHPSPAPRYPNLEDSNGERLTKDEVDTLWDYQRRTGARSAVWGAWLPSFGYAIVPGTCNDADVGLQFTPDAPLGGTGIPQDAAMSKAGLWG